MADRRTTVVVAGAGLALLLALLLVRGIPYLTEKREVIAATPTPNALSAVSPIPLAPRSEACTHTVTFSPQAQVARFLTAGAPRAKVSPLEVVASAKGYRARALIPATYPSAGPLEVAIKTPQQSVIGQFCIRNAGSKPVVLAGTSEGRTVGRSPVTVDGQQIGPQLSLTLHTAKPAALITRFGALFRHDAALNPTTPVFVWLLAIAALVVVPLGVFWALSASLAAGTAASTVADAPAVAFPWGRQARRVRDFGASAWARAAVVPGWVWLVALVAVAALWFLGYGFRTHAFQNDEARYIYLARWMDGGLPGSLFDTTFIGTGLQRLSIWILTPIVGLWGGPEWSRIGHVVYSLLFASTAIPAYLLVRGLRLSARWALLAAVLTVAVPWAVLATSFLTEPVAYPAFAFALWAIWRSATQPGWRTDALAIVMVVVAGLARVNLIAIVAALAIAPIVQELRFGARGSFKNRVFSFVRLHAVLVAAAGVGLFALLLSSTGAISGLDKFAGAYGANGRFNVPIAIFKSHLDTYTTRFVAGCGFVPFVFGLAWIVRTLFRPRDPGRFGFAVVGVAAIAAVIYSSAGAGFDERYIIYYAPVFAVAFAVALARREVPPVLVGASGLVGALLLLGQQWSQGALGAWSWFVYPAETIYANVVLGRIQTELPGHDPRRAAFVLALVVVAVCVLAASRHRAARAVTGVLIASVIAVQFFQAQDALSKYVNGAGSAAAQSDTLRSWVDTSIYGKSHAGVFAIGAGNTLTYGPLWDEVQFWNDSVTQVVSYGLPQIQVPPSDPLFKVDIDRERGLITGGRIPPYLLVARTFLGVGLDQQVVKQSPYLPLDMIRLRSRRLIWKTENAQWDGYMTPHQPVTMRVYRGPASKPAPACAVALVTAPFELQSRATLAAGKVRRSKVVAPQKTARVEVPLRWHGEPYLDLLLTATGRTKLADGREASLQIAGMAAGPCLHPNGG